jgi:hypothetical protein
MKERGETRWRIFREKSMEDKVGIEEASHLIIRSLSNDHFGDSEERNT